MIEESDDEGIVPSIALDAAKKNGKRREIRQERKKTEQPKKSVKTTGFTADTPEGPLHKPLKGKLTETEMPEGSSDKKDWKQTSVFIDDGVGDMGELMESIDKRRRSSIKEFFPKTEHKVAIANPNKRSRNASAGEKVGKKASKEGSDEEMEDVEMSRNCGLEEEAVEKDEPPPAVLQEVNSQGRRPLFTSPRAPIQGSSISSFSPNTPRSTERRTTRIMTDRQNTQRMESEWKKYEAKGEKMLVEAAAQSEDYELLPNLHRLKPGIDHCLVCVNSLLDTDPETMPIPRSAGPTEYNDRDQVQLPWDDNYITEDGLNRRAIIKRELSAFVECEVESLLEVKILFEKIYSTNRIPGLVRHFNLLEEPSHMKQHGFLELIRRIAELALRGPELFPGCIPVCHTNGESRECSVTLSQEQCACLLANAFFGVFPQDHRTNFNDFDLIGLIRSSDIISVEKLRFFLNYFMTVLKKMPTGCVSFRRIAFKRDKYDIKKYDFCSLSEVGVQGVGIENCHHALQVDFANKFIGGGTLGHGTVQEEIRFLCCPEMIVSMLLCPKMNSNEAVFIIGARQYSDYTGYGETLSWKNMESDVNQNWDRFRRIRCEVVAIDAQPYGSCGVGLNRFPAQQFIEAKIDREIIKALVGFSRKDIAEVLLPPVATGNWGCGAFNGDLCLKSMIQLIAASIAHRHVVYCPFDHKNFAVNFAQLRDRLVKNSFSVPDLYNKILDYEPKKSYSLFDFLNHACEKKERKRSESNC